MFALLLAAVASPTPAAGCTAADPAVTSLVAELFKKRDGVDHYIVTATLTNIGAQGQTPDITQRVELVRNGDVLAPQTVPALGPGVAYKLAFAIDRPASERSQPLVVTVRYLLSSGDAARNACNRANDEVTKTL